MKSMQQKIGFAAGLMAAAMLACVMPAAAHHSTAAFDSNVVVAIEGTVTQYRWINPHASIKLDGTANDGFPAGVWTVEMTAPPCGHAG